MKKYDNFAGVDSTGYKQSCEYFSNEDEANASRDNFSDDEFKEEDMMEKQGKLYC